MNNKNKKLTGKKRLFEAFEHFSKLDAENQFSQSQWLRFSSKIIKSIDKLYRKENIIRGQQYQNKYFSYDLVEVFKSSYFGLLVDESKYFKNYEQEDFESMNNYKSFDYYNNLGNEYL